jgi:hypothetical protein
MLKNGLKNNHEFGNKLQIPMCLGLKHEHDCYEYPMKFSLQNKRMTWRLHTEKIETKSLRTFIRLYSLFKSERLNAKIKLTLHKALIRSVMTYACPAWEFAAETYILKL